MLPPGSPPSFVEVCYANVATGFAAVFTVCWDDVDEGVVGSAVVFDFGG